jgi:aminoglycoside phosphotransferase family enzyme/predicted kinase
VIETHISILLFVGDRVFKLRKPVRFGFLDFGERAARAADCHREVALNRRLAPDVYLGVADLVMEGELLEHMVVMRALPASRTLASLLQNEDEVRPWLGRIAGTLASFHRTAARAPEISAAATPAALEQKWGDNFHETDRFVPSILDPSVDAEIRSLVAGWLASHRLLLEARSSAGHVCDGHGDLQAADIFCLDEGVRILDCLQFSDTLRHDDVCADIAFLAMDLERLGHPDAADEFIRAYEHASGDRLPPPLLHFHIALRAYVRAKVSCIRFEQGDQAAIDPARRLQLLARRHLRGARSALALVGGLPGTGKSTLAAGLAEETGWLLLRSDKERGQRVAGRDRYTPDAVAAVYHDLLRSARQHLDRGESVILDASWADADHRVLAATEARASQSELLAIRCVCDDAIAGERIRQRLARGDDPSEATLAVRNGMATRFDPWPSALLVDTGLGSPATTLEAAFSLLAVREATATLTDPPARPARA